MFRSVVGVLSALAALSWRDVRSFRSLGGQNFVLFVGLVALQPQSAELFIVILVIILLFPLAKDPMGKLPVERRTTWPINNREWLCIRAGSFALSPITWIAAFVLLRAGWMASALFLGAGLMLQFVKVLLSKFVSAPSTFWFQWIPAPPGILGAIMRLQWRQMLQTLDPYLAITLVACTELYRLLGKPLDSAAPKILAMLVTLALSTQTQVLLGLDGAGAQRFRQLPIRGWQLLFAKDLSFLVLLGLLVSPLDFESGFFGALAALTIGHHRSVQKQIVQTRWRFTEGAIAPDGLIQVAALFSVGSAVGEQGFPLMAGCVLAWFASLLFYGWQWDRLSYA